MFFENAAAVEPDYANIDLNEKGRDRENSTTSAAASDYAPLSKDTLVRNKPYENVIGSFAAPKTSVCTCAFRNGTVTALVCLFVLLSVSLAIGVSTLVKVLEPATEPSVSSLPWEPSVSNLAREIAELRDNLSSLTGGVADCGATLDARIRQLVLDTLNRTQQPSNPASCADLLENSPSSPSGYYSVTASNGSAVRVYCDMTRLCDGDTLGWMRVSNLDFSNDSVSCPSSFHERINSSIRTCGIQPPNMSVTRCASVLFGTSGVVYNRVCGRVLAYQYGTTNAFHTHTETPSKNLTIDSNYVDGVSLTHGCNPRKHIWTFAAALDEYVAEEHEASACECSNTERGGVPSPSFVGKDYFCDSGNSGRFIDSTEFYSTSPLWDGAGCGSNSTCCMFNHPPWFNKELPSLTDDNIEMRVCATVEGETDEDIAVSSVEIYVQ